MDLIIQPCSRLRGEVSVPGDKSISHRAVMFAALANGSTRIRGFLRGADCLSTVACMSDMGIQIEDHGHELIVHGQGLFGIKEPTDILQVGNSGTTIRLLLGILSGRGIYTVLTGDESIRRRPMGRVIKPLVQMGAAIYGRSGNTLAPVVVKGGTQLQPITYNSPVASAQVKSAVLLAGLYLKGQTTVIEPTRSRDHTERMLSAFGAKVITAGNQSSVCGIAELNSPGVIEVPGDISSAAFLLVAGCIVPNSDITIKGVGINPTRTGVLDVLQEMGADITILNQREQGGEPVADLRVCTSQLKGIKIAGEILPRLIDEIPILAVAAAVADGPTIIADAAELRVKETDRIAAIVAEFFKMGIVVTEEPDGMIIPGNGAFSGGECESYHDHRIAMAMAIAGLIAQKPVKIRNSDSIDVSFPGFEKLVKALSAHG